MAAVFTESICALLKTVPSGRVVTYGSLAAAAGSPRGARQVVKILHTQSRRRGLPWHRVVASGGRIALTDPAAAGLQRDLLCAEGVEFNSEGDMDFQKYFWDFQLSSEARNSKN